MRLHVSLRHTLPLPVLDDGANDPRDGAYDDDKNEEGGQASQGLIDRADSSELRIVVVVPLRAGLAELPQEVARVVRDLGVLRQELGERRIGFEVALVCQQRRVQGHHAAERGRVLLEQLLQPLLGFGSVCVVCRCCRSRGFYETPLRPRQPGLSWLLRFLSQRGCGNEGGQEHSGKGLFHIPLTYLLPDRRLTAPVTRRPVWGLWSGGSSSDRPPCPPR